MSIRNLERTAEAQTLKPVAVPENGLQGEALQSSLAYWKKRLGENPPVLELPTDRARLALQTYRHETHRFTLSAALVDSLRHLCRAEDVTLFEGLFAVYQILLRRYTGQNDVVTAAPLHHAANTLLLRTDMSGNPTFRELLARLRRIMREAHEHQALSFKQLARELYPQRDISSFYQTAFALQNGSTELAEAGATSSRMNGVIEKLDVAFAIAESAQGWEGTFTYNADLFDATTIQRMAGHYETLLRSAVANPEVRIAAMQMLTGEEMKQILFDWNETQTAFPHDKCLHQLFEDHVAQQPDAVAVRFADEQVTYFELNRRANQVANYLRSLGAGSEVRVGISVERSIEMAVGILSILKAGGAYVPMDPAYPQERQVYMLQDSKVSILLTQKCLVENWSAHGVKLVCLDEDWNMMAKLSAANPETGVEPDNLAYVIYTSGSTGRPKGIALRHRGVVNNIMDLNRNYGVGATDQTLVISSLSFDMCVYEVLGTLAAGGAMIMPLPAQLHDATHWAELVVRHGVTVWNSAPQLLDMLVSYTEPRPTLPPASIRVTILGGDWVPVTLPDRLKALAKSVSVIVLGGATEASIHSIVFPVKKTDPAWKSIPYGKPQNNQLAYILDANLQPVPIGVPGELHLGGIGLARGYFDRPDLTAEKFLPNPAEGFPIADYGMRNAESAIPNPHSEIGSRIYKTGDLARWKADGNIELIGRMDHQVKIRGHRIELGEIVSVLKEQPVVGEAVVIAREDEPGNKRLVAYVVPAIDQHDATNTNGATHHAEQIAQWQAIYDDTYGQDSALKLESTMNFVGWISSFTGLPFAEAELRETLEGSVERILALRPKQALEIGCGTGLVLFRVAPHCARYDATDLSPVAVQSLAQQFQKLGEKWQHVNVRQQLADDFTGIEKKAYDTVIINSVTQHFPSIDYLKKVIEGASNVVKSGGAIFIGDIRCLPHLEWFHAAIELFKASPSLTPQQLQQRVQRRVRQEKELFIDPAIFPALKQELPRINQVEIRLRRGRHHNEITKFHYDVVLHIDDGLAPQTEVLWLDWQKENLTMPALRQRLLENKPKMLGLARVPNARLADEVTNLEILASDTAPATIGELRETLKNAPKLVAVDPEEFWQMREELFYDVDICWSNERGCFDVIFRRRESDDTNGALNGWPIFPAEQSQRKPWSQYGNRPVVAGGVQKLTLLLRNFLSGRLPEYMVPSAFVFLDKLPLSPNGKIDRRALPPPDQFRPELEVDYAAPRNPIEEVLCSIWSDVLGLKRVGIHDNFFELGGHSLTATQIMARTEEAFQFDIPLRTLFESPTVAGLGESLKAQAENARIEVLAIAQALIQLNQMSDEEVDAMLAARSAR